MSDWSALAQKLGLKLKLAEPLARYTSFKIGGPAEALALPAQQADLDACLDFAKAQGLRPFFLAGGTNLLIRDGGVKGLVIKLDGEFKDFKIDGTHVHAGAGMNLALLAKKCAVAGLSGLEFAVGIPGSLGGGLIMNAGAHGGELKDVVQRIGLLRDGKLLEISSDQAGFKYRDSAFKNSGDLLLWAELELKPGKQDEMEKVMDEVLSQRRATQPIELPNAGCVFKNPAGDAAGRMIEACGLKGQKLGGAQISDKHANFVVNVGGAKASDVLGLMDQARQAVREKFGVELQNEVLIVGEEA